MNSAPTEKQQPDEMRPFATGPSHGVAVTILLAVCLGFGALRWLHLGTLWGAGPLWLLQSMTAYGGEQPYRDFSLSYPPLSLWLLQGSYHLMGSTFLTAQIVIDALSTAIVLLTYAVAVRLMSPLLALVTALLAAAMGDSGFALFTLQVYTPSMLPGAIGLMLIMIGVIETAKSGRQSAQAWLLMSAGACIAILSKPEFLAGTVACLVSVCFLEITTPGSGHVRKTLIAGAPLLVGAAAGLGTIWMFGHAVGMEKMSTALAGYGLAKISCPWWPTGLGLFGGIANIGAAAALLALLTLPFHRSFAARFGIYYHAALALCASGFLLYVLYVISFVTQSEAAQGYVQTARTMGGRFGFNASALLGTLGYLLTKRNVFLPVTWIIIAFAVIYTVRRLSVRTSPSWLWNSIYVLTMIFGGLTARQMFGDYAEAYPNVTVASYPILNILVVAFLFHAVHWVWRIGAAPEARANRAGTIAAIAFVALYGGMRTAVATTSELRAGYRTITTRAGNVGLSDPDAIAILSYVQKHSRTSDLLVDVGSNSNGSMYGGGTNFAAQLKTPIFSNIFTDITPPDWILQQDAARLRAAMPALIVGTDPIESLYGLSGAWNRCPFPGLVWAPHAANFDYSRRFPAIEFIRQHYRNVFRSGRWVVFVPKDS